MGGLSGGISHVGQTQRGVYQYRVCESASALWQLWRSGQRSRSASRCREKHGKCQTRDIVATVPILLICKEFHASASLRWQVRNAALDYQDG
jgi:hypothetical protein